MSKIPTWLLYVLAGLFFGLWFGDMRHNASEERYKAQISELRAQQESLRSEALQAHSEAKQANQSRADLAAQLEQQSKGEIHVEYKTVTRTVKEFIDRPVYVNQCLDDDGVRAINGFITGSSG